MTLNDEDLDEIAERAARRVVQLLERTRPGAFQLLSPSSSPKR